MQGEDDVRDAGDRIRRRTVGTGRRERQMRQDGIEYDGGDGRGDSLREKEKKPDKKEHSGGDHGL